MFKNTNTTRQAQIIKMYTHSTLTTKSLDMKHLLCLIRING